MRASTLPGLVRVPSDCFVKNKQQPDYSSLCLLVIQSEARMRVVYFAVPEDGDVPLKTVADGESEEARWCSVRDLESLQDSRDPGLRGGELLYWAR